MTAGRIRVREGRNGRGPEEVSALDKRIIEHLQEDGRRPFTQIALELGVSEAAVRARTNRLVERGILVGAESGLFALASRDGAR